jgi:hypothetical protein
MNEFLISSIFFSQASICSSSSLFCCIVICLSDGRNRFPDIHLANWKW